MKTNYYCSLCGCNQMPMEVYCRHGQILKHVKEIHIIYCEKCNKYSVIEKLNLNEN